MFHRKYFTDVFIELLEEKGVEKSECTGAGGVRES